MQRFNLFLLPAVWFATLTAVGAAAAGASEREAREIQGRTMGTTYGVRWVERAAGSERRGAVEELRVGIDAILERINAQMSSHREASILTRFNRSSETNWVAVPLELLEVVRMAGNISARSGGAFDITVAPIVDLWGFGPERRPLGIPPADALAAARAQVGFRQIEARGEPGAIRKLAPQVRCDVSGIAKGYAVDCVARLLEGCGIADFLVEIGGEVRARGRRADGAPWRVGIQHPAMPGDLWGAVELRDRSMATSGDYAQGFTQGGRRYSHIVDPRTGAPALSDLASVSVAHRSCAWADAWATALLVVGSREAQALANREQLAVLLLVRTAEGLVPKRTPGFPHPDPKRSR